MVAVVVAVLVDVEDDEDRYCNVLGWRLSEWNFGSKVDADGAWKHSKRIIWRKAIPASAMNSKSIVLGLLSIVTCNDNNNDDCYDEVVDDDDDDDDDDY